MVILKMVFLFTIPLPELYPVSVLQNFTSALLTGCVTAILQMIKTSLQLMEKRSGTLLTRVTAGERFMSLVRSQQCTVWSSDRSRRIRNPMRLQLSQNFLTCWIFSCDDFSFNIQHVVMIFPLISIEIKAIKEIINIQDIKEKIITNDAMRCQKDIAEKIQKQGGDYLFAVKGNQGRLNKAFEEKFPLKELNNPEHDSYAISEKSHGREETRLHIVCDVPDELIDFTFE